MFYNAGTNKNKTYIVRAGEPDDKEDMEYITIYEYNADRDNYILIGKWGGDSTGGENLILPDYDTNDVKAIFDTLGIYQKS